MGTTPQARSPSSLSPLGRLALYRQRSASRRRQGLQAIGVCNLDYVRGVEFTGICRSHRRWVRHICTTLNGATIQVVGGQGCPFYAEGSLRAPSLHVAQSDFHRLTAVQNATLTEVCS